jgi:hypothetical protein
MNTVINRRSSTMMPGRGRVIQHLDPVSAGKLSDVDCAVSSEAYSNKVFLEVQKVKETRRGNPGE